MLLAIILVFLVFVTVCLVSGQFGKSEKEKPTVEAAERVLTLLFVDIVGFSQSVELQPPRDAFRELRGLLENITEHVRASGGRVDRTLGDGMLCIFGMQGSAVADCAQRAVDCAVKIQRDHLRLSLERLEAGGRPLLPLRIGINTSAVYVGNLDVGWADNTVIGNGVNVAERLESACESYRVLIGPTTYSLLRGDEDITVRKRLIPMKHRREALEVFEIDPFQHGDPGVRRSLTAFWELLGMQRMEERWDLPEGALMHIDTGYGAGQLINFSLNGLALRLPQYLGKQLPVSIALGHDEPNLRLRLERAGIEEIIGEVRWAQPLEGGGYLHGILIKNLGLTQRHELLARLLRWLKEDHRLV